MTDRGESSRTERAPQTDAATEGARAGRSLLVKIETDRRLGHEWDEWDGKPLANGGDFRTTTSRRYFAFTAVGLAAVSLLAPPVTANGVARRATEAR